MAWHRLKHRKSGEVQVVASLGGIDADEWEAVPVLADRSPTEFQLVTDDGRLVTDDALKAKTMKRKRYAEMDRADLMDLLDDLEARLKALEKLSGR